jgi:creatinine amidohydrolase
MRIAEMDWQMVEDWTRHDDRAVLPLGSTEQHAGLSLLTDAILAERLAAEAAEPLGVPVFPALPYGTTPLYAAFPGSITLRVGTLCAVVRDVLDSLKRSGFRRILIVNGHAENLPASVLSQEWLMDNPDCRVRFHDWWRAPLTSAALHRVAADPTHANWSENFPWTRLSGTANDATAKAHVDREELRTLPPFEAREMLGDGSYGGASAQDDAAMLVAWQEAVAETRALLEEW